MVLELPLSSTREAWLLPRKVMLAVWLTVLPEAVPVNCTVALPETTWLVDLEMLILVDVIVRVLAKECWLPISDCIVPVRV